MGRFSTAVLSALLLCLVMQGVWLPVRLGAQVRLADESDRAAFRAWFVLLADAE